MLDNIKMCAKYMLDSDYIIPENDCGFIAQHPFHNSRFLPLNEKGEFILFDIVEGPEKYKIWKEQLIKQIDSSKSFSEILPMLNSAYYMNFLLLCRKDIPKKELADVLKHCWIMQEFPNWNCNEVLDLVLNIFKEVSSLIMDTAEKKIYNNLPEQVTIYRGQSKKGKRYNALSWTLDKERAEKFANRFGKGNLYLAVVKKEDIVCFFNTGEQEVIVDFNKIKGCKKIN